MVIGAGAIGLATALALLEAGRQVRVVDAGALGAATSHGNCGTITPSHAPPLAAPGMIAQALKWMLTPDAPLYIPPRLDPALWHWLLRFARRCNARDWQSSAQARAALLHDARQRLDEWVARYALECEFRTDGLDYVFGDARGFAKYRDQCALLAQWGIQAQVIEGAEYTRQDPAFREGIAGAIHFPGDAHLRPERYTAELARVLRAQGAQLDAHCRVEAVIAEPSAVCVRTAHGTLHAREVVIATGPWSPLLAAQLGLRLPVQAGKGYSITYSAPALMPRRPVVLKDRWVFVVPWRDRLRIGSTMEFSGHDTQLNPTDRKSVV